MYIHSLSLQHYRNYSRLQLAFKPGIVLLQGNNAQGKTNLLEACYFIATASTPHARSDRQLINWLVNDDPVSNFARLELAVQRQGGQAELATTIHKEGERFKKTMHLNGVKKRAMDVLGVLTTVMFLPEDIDLVTGSPGIRRRYLDSMLCQIDPHYCRALSQYKKIVTQRNALLKELSERRRTADQLEYWNEQLTSLGATLIVKRHNAIRELDAVAQQRHRVLSGYLERLRLHYTPSFDLFKRPQLNYQLPLSLENLGPAALPAPPQDDVAHDFKTELKRLQDREIARGVTLVGPHRDDLHFLIDGVDVTLYGSRGQQRTAALSAKLAEVSLMQETTGESPVLLLDDVMSELDRDRRTQVLGMVDDVEQVFITTTDWDDFSADFVATAQCYQVESGVLRSVSDN